MLLNKFFLCIQYLNTFNVFSIYITGYNRYKQQTDGLTHNNKERFTVDEITTGD